MAKIEQVNELLKKTLAELVAKEVFLENGLITISYVDCSLDLKNAQVGVSVFPENFYGTVLKKLRNKTFCFSASLRNKIKIRKIPRFNWVIDSTEKNASKIEKILDEISKQEF